MSDAIKHECGIALIRLKKPLDYYLEKYGTALYGVNKMYLLMEKQHNRGQDGAGLANIKLDMPPGTRYISRYRSNDKTPIQDLFQRVNQRIHEGIGDDREKLQNPAWLKENLPFVGELYLGHLRYGTYGGNSIEQCHPFLRQNNWVSRNLILAGNFNMTNVDELFNHLVDLGQHPKEKADTVTILEKIGHFLDEQNEKLYRKFKKQGIAKKDVSQRIADEINIAKILRKSAKKWDGGYAMAGLFGHGDAFVLRDPSGIRPAFFYDDDEITVAASERPVIQTAFNVPFKEIKEVKPGHALIIKKNGSTSLKEIRKPLPRMACSFERIYFSRGNDSDIYRERIQLGQRVCPAILNEVDHDLKHTVFSFIPNTAEISFYGMVKGMESYLNHVKRDKILKHEGELDASKLDELLSIRPRVEKIAWKDVKMRTFITEDSSRDDLVSHVYDITYETVKKDDNLVVIDDSIVRGTTLRQSILKILDRLNPKKIVVVSSAPQIRYPDCYGIDMAKLGDFVAFRAAISLLKESGLDNVIDNVYEKCQAQKHLPDEEIQNFVKDIYAPFSAEQISDKIAQLLTPPDMKAEVKIIFQKIEDLHEACPNNLGDWYFTGNFPTPGGMRVVNRAFLNFYEGKNVRAY
ncbi:MAG TPA: amidophosphoribosyltransferase [Cryomorphaceae bacterium]|nr:amidophosphoribosyltransferase [Owenweeksia sp.]HAD98572.1 amidophosphoribosyltransferase [Cryomorphaceae bacterium]HBF21847.1 amidophosphoribosyltransferase [Cryomorphaceae bacterium]|tara:strand:+ start:455 stop:2353 length:1899 start_codon:yes stop_codon:yes gene_type:complete